MPEFASGSAFIANLVIPGYLVYQTFFVTIEVELEYLMPYILFTGLS